MTADMIMIIETTKVITNNWFGNSGIFGEGVKLGVGVGEIVELGVGVGFGVGVVAGVDVGINEVVGVGVGEVVARARAEYAAPVGLTVKFAIS